MSNQPPDPNSPTPPEGGYTWESPQQPWQVPQNPHGGYPPQQPWQGDPNSQYHQPYYVQDPGHQWNANPGTPQQPVGPLPHSRWGIASLVTGGMGVLLFIVMQVIAPMVVSFQPGTIPENPTGGDIAVGLASCCSFFLIGVALILAVVGCFDWKANRMTAYVALGVLGLSTCCLGGLMALGVAVIMGGLA